LHDSDDIYCESYDLCSTDTSNWSHVWCATRVGVKHQHIVVMFNCFYFTCQADVMSMPAVVLHRLWLWGIPLHVLFSWYCENSTVQLLQHWTSVQFMFKEWDIEHLEFRQCASVDSCITICIFCLFIIYLSFPHFTVVTLSCSWNYSISISKLHFDAWHKCDDTFISRSSYGRKSCKLNFRIYQHDMSISYGHLLLLTVL